MGKHKEGCIYLRGSTYWIKFYRSGKAHHESAGSAKISDARRLLAIRLGAKATGGPLALRADKVLMRELFEDVLTHYKNNELRSESILVLKLDKYLLPHFGDCRASGITSADIALYISKRKQPEKEGKKGAENSTINRELGLIKRAFQLGKQSGKILHAPHIEMLEENNVREGFFEDEEYATIRKRLPDHVKPITDTARITGFRKGREYLLTGKCFALAAARTREWPQYFMT